MKILQIHNDYQIAGGETGVLENEKKLLQQFGHEVIQFIVSNDSIKKFSIWEKIKFFKNTVYSNNYKHVILKIINEEKPDIAHVHNVFPLISPSIYYILKNQCIPIVQTIHNFRFICPNALFYTKNKICEKCKKGNFLHALINKCYKESYVLSGLYAFTMFYHRKSRTFQDLIDSYIFLSEFSMLKFSEAGFDEKKMYYKPNFILNKINQKIDVVKKNKNFLFIGRLDITKGVFTFLDAAKNLQNYNFFIMGDGPEIFNIKKYITSKNVENVELLGFLQGKKKRNILEKMDAVILPSLWYEMFPLVILEAFMNGIPIIASDLGGRKDIILDGYNGYLYNPQHKDALDSKIELFVNASQNINFQKNCIDFYNSNYSQKINIEKLEYIYSITIENYSKN